MKTYARIYDDKVVELLEVDDNFNMSSAFNESLMWVECGPDVVPNWVYKDGVFSPPVPVVPSDDELRIAVLAQRDGLLNAADQVTAGMGDAFIAGILDDADEVMFKDYAAYKLALSKIDKQPGYPRTVEWPELSTAS